MQELTMKGLHGLAVQAPETASNASAIGTTIHHTHYALQTPLRPESRYPQGKAPRPYGTPQAGIVRDHHAPGSGDPGT